MLRITRRLNQQVTLGQDTLLTVADHMPGGVIVRVEAKGQLIERAPMKIGWTYELHVDNYLVKIHLLESVRSETFFGFEAPRELRIIATERLAGAKAK